MQGRDQISFSSKSSSNKSSNIPRKGALNCFVSLVFSFNFDVDPLIYREYKDQQPLQSFVFVFVNFVQSDILEAVESKLLTSCKACWSLYSL